MWIDNKLFELFTINVTRKNTVFIPFRTLLVLHESQLITIPPLSISITLSTIHAIPQQPSPTVRYDILHSTTHTTKRHTTLRYTTKRHTYIHTHTRTTYRGKMTFLTTPHITLAINNPSPHLLTTTPHPAPFHLSPALPNISSFDPSPEGSADAAVSWLLPSMLIIQH